jgi:hypothetical protein
MNYNIQAVMENTVYSKQKVTEEYYWSQDSNLLHTDVLLKNEIGKIIAMYSDTK